MTTYLLNNYQETLDLGKTIAANCQGGEILAVNGPLGAGKTVLAQGLAQGLGVISVVNSPTFNIIKIYPVKNHPTIKEFIHIDAYRLKSVVELEALGIREMVKSKSAVIFIEWADKVKKILPKKYFKIDIKIINKKDQRQINIS